MVTDSSTLLQLQEAKANRLVPGDEGLAAGSTSARADVGHGNERRSHVACAFLPIKRGLAQLLSMQCTTLHQHDQKHCVHRHNQIPYDKVADDIVTLQTSWSYIP
jgi:hypothetical protein